MLLFPRICCAMYILCKFISEGLFFRLTRLSFSLNLIHFTSLLVKIEPVWEAFCFVLVQYACSYNFVHNSVHCSCVVPCGPASLGGERLSPGAPGWCCCPPLFSLKKQLMTVKRRNETVKRRGREEIETF